MSGSGLLVVVGDLLLDREVLGSVDRLCPEAPVPVLRETSILDRPGGAGLGALFAASGDREVVLIAAVSADDAGDRLRELVTGAGVRLVELPLHGPTPEKIRLRSAGHLLMRLDRGDAPVPVGRAPAEALAALHGAGAILVCDYGRGVSAQPQLRAALTERAQCAPLVWDPHPRGEAPVPAARLVTPNRAEADGFVAARANGSTSGEWPLAAVLRPVGVPDTVNGKGSKGNGNGRHHAPTPLDAATSDLASAASAAVRLRRLWSAGAVVVTLAERGAVLSDGVHPPLLIPTPFPAHGDGCGAGDRFAAAAVSALAGGANALDAVTAAVTAATAYVAAGGALALHPELHRRSDGAPPVGTPGSRSLSTVDEGSET
jgi:bifunctional ADP-heptose synthase (sugar kinase/adenylyltransferase)